MQLPKATAVLRKKELEMKKSSKIFITLIIVILVLLLGAVGTFAYVYFATDLLKSDKELFFKYLAQLTAEEDGFINKNIEKFHEKQEQNSFENSGTLTVNANIPASEIGINENILEKVNDLKVSFSGKSNPLEKQAEQNIKLDYGNDVIFPINYKQDGEMLGLQTNYVGSKYIAIENNNLKELATKMGLDSTGFPDKIEFKQKTEDFEFTAEEIAQLKEKYGAILEGISKEHFSRSETQMGIQYILTLSGEEIKDILINLLETFKQDTILTSKINKLAQETGDYLDTTAQEKIQELIDGLNAIDSPEIKELKITIRQKDKILNQILIEYDTSKIEIVKNEANDSLSYVINIQSTMDLDNTISDKNSSSQINICLSCIYNGLSTLEAVQESYKLDFNMNIEDGTIGYSYMLNNNVQFNDSLKIDYLDEDTALILNDYDSATIQQLMISIVERLVTVNKDMMDELGLEATENPIIYSNLITMSEAMIYNMANDAVNNSMNSLDDTAMQIHNSKFEAY